MKFAYLEGPYKEFNGYPFVNGKPTPVTDAATIKALLKRADFRRVDDEKAPEAPKAEVLKPVFVPPPQPYSRREILRARPRR